MHRQYVRTKQIFNANLSIFKTSLNILYVINYVMIFFNKSKH